MIGANMRIERDFFRAEFKSELTPLMWLSFALKTGALWYLGRGAWRIIVERFKVNDTYTVEVRPDCKVLPFFGSAAMQLKTAMREGYFKADIAAPDRWTEKSVKKGTTLIHGEGWKDFVNLGTVAFSIAEGTTGFFMLGATRSEWQACMKFQQAKFDVGMTRAQLKEMADPVRQDYDASTLITVLDWK